MAVQKETHALRKTVADAVGLFHIVLPIRSKVARDFDEDLNPNKTEFVLCLPCLGTNADNASTAV